MTNSKIDTHQNYFEIALRQIIGNLEKVRNSVIACISNLSGYYVHCPKNKRYMVKNNGTGFYKSERDFAVDVVTAILLIYKDLTKRENLMKCLLSKT